MSVSDALYLLAQAAILPLKYKYQDIWPLATQWKCVMSKTGTHFLFPAQTARTDSLRGKNNPVRTGIISNLLPRASARVFQSHLSAHYSLIWMLKVSGVKLDPGCVLMVRDVSGCWTSAKHSCQVLHLHPSQRKGNRKPHSRIFREEERLLTVKNTQLYQDVCPLIFIRVSDDVAPEVKETDRFDGVVLETEKLTHPTANRAKPPQRRPPSGLITATQVSELFLRFVFPTQILSMTFATWVCQATALGSDTRVSNFPPGTWCVFDSVNAVTFSHVFLILFQFLTIIKDHTGGMVTLRDSHCFGFI